MKLRNKYWDKFAMKLADDGERLIQKAYSMADYNKNKTQNLHDSYGSAVFFNRKLYPGTKRFFTKKATTSKYDPYEAEYITGRRAIENFFGTYRPATDDFQLVVAVAMFYGRILEKGLQGGQIARKYKVISMIGDDVRQLADKIGGARVETIQVD